MTKYHPLLLISAMGFAFLSAHADWRSDAEARIEQHRKADLNVVVTDSDGNPVDGATVGVEMQRHAFNFGTTIRAARILTEDDEDSGIYREKILEHFNSVVFGNAHKWRFWEREGEFSFTFYVEDTGDAAEFTSVTNDLSDRPLMSETVNWSGMSAWIDRTEVGPIDVTELVKAATNHPDWESRNAIAFIIPEGSGYVNLFSHDADSDLAARLEITRTDDSMTRRVPRDSSDDAEENPSNGDVGLGGNDLSFGRRIIGIRVPSVPIESGAEVARAELYFTARRDHYGREIATAASDWAFNNDLELRYHVLMWPREDGAFLPNDVRDAIDEGGEANKTYVRERIEGYIQDATGYYGDMIRYWDVLNEVTHERYVTDFLNEGQDVTEADEIIDWFSMARDLLGEKAFLVLNDFDMITDAQGSPGNRDRNAAIVDHIRDNGATVDGVGMQAHFYSPNLDNDPETMYDVIDRYAQMGLGVEITEFDYWNGTGTWTPQQVVDLTEKLYTVVFSHPASESIMQWGFWDGQHWQNSGPTYTEDWQLKASGERFLDLVSNQWWTDNTEDDASTRQTGSDGAFDLRAFKGEHLVTAEKNGKMAIMRTFAEENRALDLVLTEADTTVYAQALRRFDDAQKLGNEIALIDEQLVLSNDRDTGLRFRGIPVPGGDVSGAYLHLTPAASGSGTVTLTIGAEASTAANPFDNKVEHFDGRDTTGETVTWEIPGWTEGETIVSPDISAILPSLSSAADPVSLALLIESAGDALEVMSFDGNPAAAPILELRFGGSASPWDTLDEHGFYKNTQELFEPGIGWVYDRAFPFVHSYGFEGGQWFYYFPTLGDQRPDEFYGYNFGGDFYFWAKHSWGYYYKFSNGSGWYSFGE